ncbi:alpha/beta hydrolase [Modestobacter lapidis]|nr:alpha/beta hydrolase [Modestobacter lapidis]
MRSGPTPKRLLTILTALMLLAGTNALTAAASPRNDDSSGDAGATYSNPTGLDTIEWLPNRPADYRILYGDSPLTFGDLRLPERAPGRDGYPVVVFMHGGQWESSWSLSYTDQLVEALTRAGVATWSLEYSRRNNPGGGWPGTFLDVANGTDYLRELDKKFPLDLDRTVAMGHSSGGTLALWLAGRDQLPADSELYMSNPLPIHSVVDLAGVLDFDLALQAGRDDVLQLLGVETAEQAAERFDDASPRHLLPLGVPQHLIIGTLDADWRNDIHRRYTEAARAAGDDVELTVLEGANHFDVVDVCGPAWAVVVNAVFSHLDEEPSPGAFKWPSRHVCQSRG